MRKMLIGAFSALVLLGLMPSGNAAHTCCTCPTYATTGVGGVGLLSTQVGANGDLQFFVAAAKGNFYVVVDRFWSSDIWIYQETNGDGGLQRHDSTCYTEGFNADDRRDLIIY